jgi:hypothetical protein
MAVVVPAGLGSGEGPVRDRAGRLQRDLHPADRRVEGVEVDQAAAEALLGDRVVDDPLDERAHATEQPRRAGDAPLVDEQLRVATRGTGLEPPRSLL